MKHKIKAALLSALIFPGLGQISLKKYLFGGILASIAFLALAVILQSTVKRSLVIAEKIQSGEIPLDFIGISNLILEQPVASDTSFTNAAWWSLLSVWIISICHSLLSNKPEA